MVNPVPRGDERSSSGAARSGPGSKARRAIASTTRRASVMPPGVASEVFGSDQSTGAPSAMRIARSRSLRSSGSGFMHGLRQLDQRSRHRHASGIGGGLADRLGDLLVAEAELDAQHDGLALLVAQPGERALEALHAIAPDHFVERGGPRIGQRLV